MLPNTVARSVLAQFLLGLEKKTPSNRRIAGHITAHLNVRCEGRTAVGSVVLNEACRAIRAEASPVDVV